MGVAGKVKLSAPLLTRFGRDLEHRRKEFEYGVRIHVEYEFLRNTDLNWLFGEVRTSARDELSERELFKRRAPITFEVAEIRTGQSVTAIFLGGVITGVAANGTYDVLKSAGRRMYARLREKNVRRHFHRVQIQVIRQYPDGSFEVEEDFGDALEGRRLQGR